MMARPYIYQNLFQNFFLLCKNKFAKIALTENNSILTPIFMISHIFIFALAIVFIFVLIVTAIFAPLLFSSIQKSSKTI